MKKDGASAVIISGELLATLPGGGIEDGETPLEGLQRELFEEVTYVPQNLQPMGYFDNMLGKNYLYIAYVTPEEEQKFTHKRDEGQEIGIFTVEQIILKHEIPSAEVLGMINIV